MVMPHERRKPRIGVTGPEKGGKLLWRFTQLGVWLGGGRAIRLIPKGRTDFKTLDGFVIAGGGDINPELYGESAVIPEAQYDPARDALEQEVIRHAFQHNIPVLGICRGMQMLNVTLGGSLYQEAKEVLEDFLPSRSLLSKFIGRRDVQISQDSRLFTILGQYTHYRVNSIHHQAVNVLGNGLRIVAREKNGLIQAIELQPDSTHPFIIGVQWHPELMLHARSARRLFRALVDAAKP